MTPRETRQLHEKVLYFVRKHRGDGNINKPISGRAELLELAKHVAGSMGLTVTLAQKRIEEARKWFDHEEALGPVLPPWVGAE